MRMVCWRCLGWARHDREALEDVIPSEAEGSPVFPNAKNWGSSMIDFRPESRYVAGLFTQQGVYGG
jgi:hypothetical protein